MTCKAPSLLLSTSLLALSSCSLDFPPLGEDEKDTLELSKSKLAHIGKALDGGDDLTLMDLFTLGDDMPFSKAPDPTKLLNDMNALDDARSRAGKVRVTVLDYNVALLDAVPFGLFTYARTPDLEERRRALPGLVFGTGADVIGLQEVWREQDVEEFLRHGEELGYRGFLQDRSGYNDGLMIFLREAAIAGGTTPKLADHAPYLAQDAKEFLGIGVKRGFLEVEFVHAEAGPARVFNTHTQAYSDLWTARMHQGRELGIRAREHPAAAELVLVLGDLNSGPFYEKDEWEGAGADPETWWFENTIAYPLILEYGDLVDAAILGRPADQADDDVELGKTVKNDASKALDVPMADADWCDDTPKTTFTAWDCNSLYFNQYAGTEYPARLDHVHVRDRPDLVVTKSELVFTEREPFDGVTVEPSDHYGVRVELLVDPG